MTTGLSRMCVAVIAMSTALPAMAQSTNQRNDDARDRYDRDDDSRTEYRRDQDDRDRYQTKDSDRYPYERRNMPDRGGRQDRFDRDHRDWDRDESARTRDRYDDESWFEDDVGRPVRIHGEIVDMRTMRLAGMREPHVFLKVDRGHGDIARVKLGPKSDMDRLRLRHGDDITVNGTRCMVNDRTVVLAERIQARGRTITVAQEHVRAGREINGTILSTWTASVLNDRERHLMVSVQTNNGQATTMDLGRVSDVEGITFRRGQTISASVLASDGRASYVAESLWLDGRRVQMNRAAPDYRIEKTGQTRFFNDRDDDDERDD